MRACYNQKMNSFKQESSFRMEICDSVCALQGHFLYIPRRGAASVQPLLNVELTSLGTHTNLLRSYSSTEISCDPAYCVLHLNSSHESDVLQCCYNISDQPPSPPAPPNPSAPPRLPPGSPRPPGNPPNPPGVKSNATQTDVVAQTLPPPGPPLPPTSPPPPLSPPRPPVAPHPKSPPEQPSPPATPPQPPQPPALPPAIRDDSDLAFMYVFDADSCAEDGFYRDLSNPTDNSRIIDNGGTSRCERSGAGTTGVFHGSECIWWRDIRGAWTGSNYTDRNKCYVSVEEMITYNHIDFTWSGLPPTPPPPPRLPSPPPAPPPPPREQNGPDICDAREHHARSRDQLWGNPNYGQGIGSAFTVETWLSSIDLKHLLSQRIDDVDTVADSYNDVTGEATWLPSGPTEWRQGGYMEKLRWPMSALDYSAYPNKRNTYKGAAPGGQFVIFSIMEPGSTAPWPRRRLDTHTLEELCKDPTEHGFGMALTINHNGCFQIILGTAVPSGPGSGHPASHSGEGHFGCVTIPGRRDPDQGGGCPDRDDALRPDQWIDTGLLSNGIIRERLSTIMDAQVMRGLFNSMIESPTTPHHFVMSVNGLQYRSLAQQLQERTNAGLGENTYAPRWALYIDGQVAMSSMRATHMVELAFPLWDQPPHVTSANTDLQTASVFHDPREEYGPPHNLSVSNIITESMRLYVGVEGYPQHRWVVKTPHMVDPSETDGIDDVKIRLLRTRNPIMNTHPFNGAVEMIAVHKHAFTKQEAVAHHSAGLPNRPPRITTGLTDLSVLEDVCGALDLTADDDDVARYGKIQNVTWNVLSTMYPIYTNNNCTTQASIDETTTYSALYYKGPFNFYGPYGSMVVRAYDGQAFSRQRNIALMISPVNDAYMLHNATATIEPLGVANFTIIGTSPDTQMQATNGFRLKIVSLPAHGNLFDGDPNAGEVASGPPLAVGSITTDNVIYYQSLESMLVASTIAHTDLFLLTGVASRSDAESHIVGGVEVNVLSGLLPQTTTAVVTEDDNSFVTLRAFYTGLTLNVTFQIVGTNLVSLYQADGSPIVGASPGTPVQLTGPVIECADDSNYKCTTLSVRTAQDLTGRRLQTVFASPATFTYEVIAEGVISEPATVSISIVSVLDPITDFVCATAHNFSRFTSTVTYPLLNNVNFSDTPGTGEYMYVSITSRSYEFDVSATTLQGPADVHPPLASQFQTLGYQAYDMVGFCPSVCTTMSSSSTNAQYGLRCGTCLADTIDSTGVTSFRAVMETSLVKQVLDSVKISMQTQGYIPSYDGFINVELYKFDNETSGFFNQCNVALFAEEEAYFEMYAEAGQCLFHSSIGLLERIIGLAACTWFYWNGPIFWWIRTGTLTGGIVTRVLVAVWFTGISALFVLCCIFCVVCASQAFVRYVLATMRKLNTFLDQEENKDRGDRVEASFPQVVCLYGTFYGCFCCCPSWCLPRRENDTNGFQRLQYFAWAYLTFKLIPALRPRGEPPGPSWSEWTWDYFSWFLCRGFGLVPSMKSWESRHHADAQKLKQQRANASARRKGKEPPFKEQENLINNLPAATKKFPDVKPTWREWLWEQLSRLLCYGFGQVETLKPWSKRKEERKANSENQKIRVSL